jgi:hypothetical protein
MHGAERSWNHHRFTGVEHHGLFRVSFDGAGVVEPGDLLILGIENNDPFLPRIGGQSSGTGNQLEHVEFAKKRISPGMLDLPGDVDPTGVNLHDLDGDLGIADVLEKQRANEGPGIHRALAGNLNISHERHGDSAIGRDHCCLGELRLSPH